MIRFGLCCQFHEEPIQFRTTTAAALLRLPPGERLEKLAAVCRANADALLESLRYCAGHGIGSFRVLSQLLPLKTHPSVGYELIDLPGGEEIRRILLACGRFARENDLRLTFHPDQFVVLNSPRGDVVAASIAELEYQAGVAAWIGADAINIHAGGVYGEKPAALAALRRTLERLPDDVRSRLTLENDDRSYTPADLLPLCRELRVPFVYDVHHHRCLPDGMTVEAATEAALGTWNREPLFHLSSPREGWLGPAPQRHHDFIDVRDFPACWESLGITVEVEAKAKEVAIARLRTSLARRARRRVKPTDYLGASASAVHHPLEHGREESHQKPRPDREHD